MADLPRVLIFTKEIPQSIYAGCQQLYRVFQSYPPEKLMVIGPAPVEGADRLCCAYRTFVPRIDRWINSRLHRWANLANALGVAGGYPKQQIKAMLGDFRPQVVFTVMDLFSFYRMAWLYAREAGIPLVTLTMDDPMHFQRVPSWAAAIQKRAVKRIYGDAALSLGVSREMAEWIDMNFGKKTQAFYFGPPDGLEPRSPSMNGELRQPPHLTVGFAGSLHFYGRELQRLVPAFEQTGTRLHFYGDKTRELPASPAVVDRGMWKIDELWPVVQRECDALILPYPGAGWLENVFRTHFPTKLSEYLWQGMPVVATGPAYATGLRWAAEHRDGCLALTDPAVEEFAAVLRGLRDDAGRRVALGRGAADLARRYFEPQAVRTRFRDYLVRAAAGAKS
jgi:hypothetical protein